MFELIPKDMVTPPKQATIRISTLVPRDKITLKTANDVHKYVEKLKENLLNEIENDKQIIL